MIRNHRAGKIHSDDEHLWAPEGSPQIDSLEPINAFLRQRRAEILCQLLAAFTEKAETALLDDCGQELLAGFTEHVQNFDPEQTAEQVEEADHDGNGHLHVPGQGRKSLFKSGTRSSLGEDTEGIGDDKREGCLGVLERICDQFRSLPLVPEASEGGILRRCFILFEDSSKSILGKVILVVMVLTIAVSTVAYVMESMPDFQYRSDECARRLKNNLKATASACEPKPDPYFYTIEAVCIIIFTVDYAVRVFTVHAGSQSVSSALSCTLRYIKKLVNIVDLVAILPFYLQIILGSHVDLKQLGSLRLLRILRIFKLAKLHPGVQMFWEVLVMSGQPLVILMFLDAIIILVFAAVIFTVEGSSYSVDPKFTRPQIITTALGNSTVEAPYPTGVYAREDWILDTGLEPTPFRSILYAIWWVCVTTTTVGYGDYAPKTALGQFIGVACFYVGIIFLALPISVLGSNFEIVFRRHVHEEKPKPTRKSKRASMAAGHPTTFTDAPWFPAHGCIRKRIFIIFECPTASRLGKIISILVMVTIFVVTLSFIMESMPDFNDTPEGCNREQPTKDDCEPEPYEVFNVIEVIGISIFTVDYVCRIATVHAVSPLDAGVELEDDCSPLLLMRVYASQWLNVLDFFAIAAFYIQLCLNTDGVSSFSSVLRVLRLIRVFRVLKMPQLSSCVSMFVSIITDSMPAILLLIFLTLVTSVLIASIIVFAEGTDYSVDHFSDTYPEGLYIRQTYDGRAYEPTPFKSIPAALWWFFTTATTVGYGDHYPTTGFGRCVGIITFYLGIVLLALPITIIGGQFDKHYRVWLRDIQEMQQARPSALESNNRVSHVVPVKATGGGSEDSFEPNGINKINDDVGATELIDVIDTTSQGETKKEELFPAGKTFLGPSTNGHNHQQACINGLDLRISEIELDAATKDPPRGVPFPAVAWS